MSKSETITCNENGYFASFTSDRYGFNNKDDKWSAKKIDYLIFGEFFLPTVNVYFQIRILLVILKKLTNRFKTF